MAQQDVHCLRGVMHYLDITYYHVIYPIVTILYDLWVLYRSACTICHVVVLETHNNGIFMQERKYNGNIILVASKTVVNVWSLTWVVQNSNSLLISHSYLFSGKDWWFCCLNIMKKVKWLWKVNVLLTKVFLIMYWCRLHENIVVYLNAN